MLITFLTILAVPVMLFSGYVSALFYLKIAKTDDKYGVLTAGCFTMAFGFVALVCGAFLLAGFVSHV